MTCDYFYYPADAKLVVALSRLMHTHKVVTGTLTVELEMAEEAAVITTTTTTTLQRCCFSSNVDANPWRI